MSDSQKPLRQLFFDTETTGLSHEEDRILQVGIVEMIDRRLTGNDVQWFINPQHPIGLEAIAIHGITFDRIEHEPVFAEVVDEIMAFINGAELIIHNASFDVRMMDAELARLDRQPQEKIWGRLQNHCHITDSVRLARRVDPGKRGYKLDDLCDRLGISRQQREKHDALLDCQLLAQVYLRLTGGQQSLFADADALGQPSYAQKPLQDYQHLHLPEAMVSEAENQQHEQYLHSLQAEYSKLQEKKQKEKQLEQSLKANEQDEQEGMQLHDEASLYEHFNYDAEDYQPDDEFDRDADQS